MRHSLILGFIDINVWASHVSLENGGSILIKMKEKMKKYTFIYYS